MEEKGLSPGMLLHQAWKIFKNNWFFLIAVFLIGYLIILIPTVLQVYINKPSAFLQGVFAIINILVSLFISIGWIKISLKLAKGEKRHFSDLFKGFTQILNLFVAELLVALAAVFAPLLTFFIIAAPGLYIANSVEGDLMPYLAENPISAIIAFVSIVLAVALSVIVFYLVVLRFMLVPYFVVDCYEGPIEAMKMSSRASKGVKWDLLALFFISLIILLFGLLFFFVGVIIALPIVYLAYALAYKELVETTPWQAIAK